MKLSNLRKSLVVVIAAMALTSAMPGDGALTRNGNQVVVNTTTIAADIKGYNGPIPLKIYISNNKIEKIEALPNEETPKYFFRVKKEMLTKWNGMTVTKAMKAEVDGVTGATISSDCLKKTVKRGLEYYKKQK